MSTRSDFDRKMNSLLGKATGKNYTSTVAPKVSPANQKNAARIMGNVGSKNFGIPSSSANSSNPNYSNVDVAPNFDVAETAPELIDYIGQVMGSSIIGEGIGPDWTRPIKNVGKDALSRAADIISRPLYGVYNGYIESKEAQLERPENQDDGTLGFDFGNLGDDFKNFGSGFLKGFTGAEDEDPTKTNKSTPGNAVELFTKKDFDSWKESGVPVLGNDSFQTWSKRTAGLGGEIFGDPANLIGGKAVGSLRGGARYSNTAARNALLREATEKALESNPLRTTVKYGGTKAGQKLPPFSSRNAANFITDTLAQSADDTIITAGQRAVAANAAATRGTLVAQATQELARSASKKFDSTVERLFSGKLTRASKTYKNAVASDELVKKFDDEFLRISKRQAANGNLNTQAAFREAAELVRESVVPSLDDFAKKLDDQLRGSMYNTFALRVGSKTLPINVLGRGLEAVRGKTRIGAPTAFSINKQLPGKALQKSRYARAAGHVAYEQYRQRIKSIASKYSRSEREEISKLIHNHPNIITDPTILDSSDHLYAGVKAIKDEYRKVLQAEVSAGVRSASDLAPANYQNMYVKPKLLQSKTKRETVDQLKESRRAEGGAGDNLVTSPSAAKEAGIPVSTDPFEALSHRVISSERKISKSFVTDGFFRTYGFSGKIDPKLAKSQGWQKIAELRANGRVVGLNGADVNKDLQAYVKKTGEDLYLPKDIAEAFHYYQNITEVGRKVGASKELQDALAVYDKLLNLFKVTATVPYPGFHVKNMAGDIFMGLMDGVGPGAYSKFIRERNLLNNLTKSPKRTTFNKAWMPNKLADETYAIRGGSGGFVEAEIIPSTKFGAGVRNAPRTTAQKARGVSEWREDLGRRVHFNHALEQELKVTWPTLKGEITPEVMKDTRFIKALDNATYRVDKFKFDYGALTATEKNLMRRTIPFYTFMRKSGPMMLEGMLTNPAIFGKTQRAFPEGGDGIPGLAPWQRELGLADISGGNEPLLLPENILPYDQLLDITRDPLSPQNYIDFALNSSAPLPKSLLELAYDKNTFTGGQLSEDGERLGVKDSLMHILGNNLAPVRSAQGIKEDLEDDIPFDMGEFLGGSRFALGLGIRKLRNEDQMNNLKGDVGYIKEELGKLTEEVRDLGISISWSPRSEGTSVIVKESIPRADGNGNEWNELYEGTLDEALTVFEKTVASRDRSDTSNENVKYVNEDRHVKYGSRGSVSANPLNRILERED